MAAGWRDRPKRVFDSPLAEVAVAVLFCGAVIAIAVYLTGQYRHLAFLDHREDLAAGVFTLASIMGTMAGFVVAAMVFLGGASGPAVERMRRQVGVQLPNLLALSIVILFLAAVATAICGVFATEWVARGIVASTVVIALGVVVFVTCTIWVAFYRDIRDEGSLGPRNCRGVTPVQSRFLSNPRGPMTKPAGALPARYRRSRQ